jgi:glutamate N-acetyltransferase/amino-acid N-acetyltransferase
VSAASVIQGGVATPRGFRAAGISAGIKANGKPDLMLLVADAPAQIAAVFTTNKVIAAPVIVSKDHLGRSGGTARAIVVNSGCANACTGDVGLRDAREMTAEIARLVGCPVEQVLVSSTGVIGVSLDPRTVTSGIIAAHDALSPDAHADAARAITWRVPAAWHGPLSSTAAAPTPAPATLACATRVR